ALDDKIELNRRMNKTLEGMARAIFQDWFVAFGPTRAKMEGRPPYHAPDLWALFPDRLDAEGKPEGWDTGPLSSLMEIISGGTPPTSDSSSWNGQIPWYSVVDAPSDTDLFVFDTQRKLTSHGLQRSPGSLIAANTVIVSARGTVGKLAIAGVEMTFNQSCYALRPLRGFGDRGLFFAMKNAVSRFHDLAHGAVFDTITKATFDAIQSILPPASVARAFEDIAEPLMLRIKANVEEGRSLAATRDLLLPRLMSGELRVKDAERAVEEAA
ncbi:MAG: restriction endonuclease subunit S, partial [Roseomonas mucosa]|nr:restriction endonuclease subunit S [Roseomonas mucosa]